MMKRKILITGVTGVGKSTIVQTLKSLGYPATDIERIKGMFKVYRISTKKPFRNYDRTNPKHLHDADWLCDARKLKSLLKVQKPSLAFYGGIASNMDEIFPLFDKVFVLQLDKKALNERLRKGREGTDHLGAVQAARDVILGWKDWWEGEMKKKGAIFISANKSTEEVANEVLKKSKIEP